MMRPVRLLFLVAGVAAMTMSCGDKDSSPNPAGPSNNTPPPVTPPFPLLLVNCFEDYGPGYRCRAEYWTSSTEQFRDVTGFSTWSTSDRTIATVDTTGYVTVAREGNVAIRATYRDLEGFATLSARVRSSSR
jgi:Big-like domain-containing protein